MSRLSAAVAACLLMLGASGCGNNLSSLEGTVFVDGKPAPEGVALVFTPLEAGGSPSYAATDAEGRYKAAFTFRKPGIQPGKHRVQLVPGHEIGGPTSMPQLGPDGKPVPSERPAAPRFPGSYYEEITTVTVEPGSNEIDIQLTSAKK